VTTIEYGIPTAGQVTLTIFNMLGEEAATAESSYRPAGTYRVTFDASHFASGIYLYEVRSCAFVATKKMALLK